MINGRVMGSGGFKRPRGEEFSCCKSFDTCCLGCQLHVVYTYC